MKSIINHFWWGCSSCGGDGNLLKNKWLSLTYYVKVISTKWLKDRSQAFIEVDKVIKNKKLVSDLEALSKFKYIGYIEVYHAL